MTTCGRACVAPRDLNLSTQNPRYPLSKLGEP